MKSDRINVPFVVCKFWMVGFVTEHIHYKAIYISGKTFVMTGALTSHMRKHNNTMTQCPCPTCGKIFNRPGALADHVRVHTGRFISL